MLDSLLSFLVFSFISFFLFVLLSLHLRPVFSGGLRHVLWHGLSCRRFIHASARVHFPLHTLSWLVVIVTAKFLIVVDNWYPVGFVSATLSLFWNPHIIQPVLVSVELISPSNFECKMWTDSMVRCSWLCRPKSKKVDYVQLATRSNCFAKAITLYWVRVATSLLLTSEKNMAVSLGVERRSSGRTMSPRSLGSVLVDRMASFRSVDRTVPSSVVAPVSSNNADEVMKEARRCLSERLFQLVVFSHIHFFLLWLRFSFHFSSILLFDSSSVLSLGARIARMFWSPFFDGSVLWMCGHACQTLSFCASFFCCCCCSLFLFWFPREILLYNVPSEVTPTRRELPCASPQWFPILFWFFLTCVCLCARRSLNWPRWSRTEMIMCGRRWIPFLFFFFSDIKIPFSRPCLIGSIVTNRWHIQFHLRIAWGKYCLKIHHVPI